MNFACVNHIMHTTTYLLLRLAVGTSFFGHGLVRLPKLTGFSNWMTGQFAHSFLPYALIKPFALGLPVAEFLIGCLLLSGLFTRAALIAASWVMIILIFGTCMIENWDALVSQLLHSLLLAVLLQFLPANTYALDKLMGRKETTRM